MRKLTANFVALVVLVLIGSAWDGCVCSDVTPCEHACSRWNDLNCGAKCDCSVCDQAPAECTDYFICVENKTCHDIELKCNASATCQSFFDANCQ